MLSNRGVSSLRLFVFSVVLLLYRPEATAQHRDQGCKVQEYEYKFNNNANNHTSYNEEWIMDYKRQLNIAEIANRSVATMC